MEGQENVDARRALGVRPGQRPGRLKLQIDSALKPSVSRNNASDKLASPVSPSTSHSPKPAHGRAGSTSIFKSTSPKASTSKEGFRRMRRPTLARHANTAISINDRGQYETRKLLTHLLDRLEARPPPPDLLDRAALNARKATGKAKGKGRRHVVHIGETIVSAAHLPIKGHQHRRSGSEASSSKAAAENYHLLEEGEWYTDQTCDLVEQMRDLLILADKQKMDLFGISNMGSEATRSSSSSKRAGSRFSSTGFVARGSDGYPDGTPTVSGPVLLERLVGVIRSLLTVDCIHKAVQISLLRPPHILQAFCLDVAAVLYHKGSLDVQLALMDAVIASLYGVADALRDKVCEWLEGRLGEQLHNLARELGEDIEASAVVWKDPFQAPPAAASPPILTSPSVPTFAFSAEPEDMAEDGDAEAQGEGWMRFSPTARTSTTPWDPSITGVLSTHDISEQLSQSALQIAALVPKLLVALTSTIDLATSKLTTVHRVHRLLSLILTAKPDASLDLLEIVALGPQTTKKRALAILSTFYPNAMGHNVIARRPALSGYSDHRLKWETGQERVLSEDDTEGHIWLPWKANSSRQTTCYTCHQLCSGFCVRCSLCGDIKHVECLKLYRDELMECHVMDAHTGTKQTSRMRFSKRARSVEELGPDCGFAHGSTEATVRRVGKHVLHKVNLFTITLCAECQKPLWGSTSQGYACMGLCQQFFHPACVETLSNRAAMRGSHAGLCLPGFEIHVDSGQAPSWDRFSIHAQDLKPSFEQWAGTLINSTKRLQELSYDEATLLHAELWLQYEIFNNGVKSKSIKIVSSDGSDGKDCTRMADMLISLQQYLGNSGLSPSSALNDFTRIDSRYPQVDHDWLWHPEYLHYCAALLKSPNAGSESKEATRLLTVGRSSESTAKADDLPSATYQALHMPTIRQTFATDLQLRDHLAVSLLLEQLCSIGLCNVPTCNTVNVPAVQSDQLMVAFVIPQLMDGSPAVEILIMAIERLLDDVDLTANEQGLKLLCDRAWPTSMCSPFALERLGGTLLTWIMAEDDVLHHIVKNYASKHRRPPGVRSVAKDTTAVANYKDDRNFLIMRYAHAWLEALHNEDPAMYASLAYDRSKVIDDRWDVVELAKGDEAGPQAAGFALERLTTLADANVSFSVTLDLLIAWLDDVGGIARDDVIYKSLPRLLRHTSGGLDTQGNLWEQAQATSVDDAGGLQRVCRWLRVMACSGAEVPWIALKELLDLSGMDAATEDVYSDLVTAIDTNVTAIDPEDFASFCNAVLTRVIMSAVEIQSPSTEAVPPKQIHTELLSKCMTMLLRSYGTSTADIETTALNTAGFAKQAEGYAKRKPHFLTRPAKISLSLDAVIAAADLLRHPQYPPEVTLDFLHLLFAKTPLADNVDGFLHHVCPELYEAIWPLYGRQVDRRCRTRVFLKLVTINAIPVERMIAKQAEHDREVVCERLLTLVLDLADDSVTSDVTGWRRSCTGIILQLLNYMLDPSTPAAHNIVIWQALLPTQLQAVSLCFEDHLLFGNDEQRLVLLAQLLHLQSYRPTWPIVGWEIIEQIVTEQLTTIQQFETAHEVQALAALSDAWTIRAAALALGLHMLAAGVPCEWKVLQRFQQHVAAACAQPWPTPADAITGILLPALKQVLDATVRITVQTTDDDDKEGKKTALVGSQFVSVVISFASGLSKWDFMVQRYILDIVLVVFFKHNVHTVELAALNALEQLALYTLGCTNAQNGIMALQILCTAQTRMTADRFSRVLPQLFVIVADILVQAIDNDGDTVFIDSARSFLQDSLRGFGKSGLVLQVLRVDGLQVDRSRPNDSVARALSVVDCAVTEDKTPTSWLDLLFQDLNDIHRWNRERIGPVLVSLSRLSTFRTEPISAQNATAFGEFLSRLAKQAGDWDLPSDFDPNPTLQASAALLDLSPPGSSTVLLHQVATFVHFVLGHFNVSLKSINDLVKVSLRVARDQQENTIVSAVLGLTSTGLSGLSMPSATMVSLLQFIAGKKDPEPWPTLNSSRAPATVEASSKCVGGLTRSHPVALAALGNPEITTALCDAASAVIVRAEMTSPGNLGIALRTLPSEAAVVQLNVLGYVLYASLDMTLGPVRKNLVTLYPIMARAASLCLFACSDLLSTIDHNNDGAHFVTVVFITLRLSILAAYDPEVGDTTPALHEALAGFWRRIWPDWDRLLRLAVAPSCVNIPLRAVVLSVVEDVVIFVTQACPSLLVEPAPLIGRGLRAIEEYHSASKSTPSGKLLKALAALDNAVLRPAASAPGRLDLASDWSDYRRAAAKSVWNDIVATERLFVAERVRDPRARDRERAPTRVGFRA